ncbi:MAG: hypothetical protein ABIP03_12480 [Aquihabitans sp.]
MAFLTLVVSLAFSLVAVVPGASGSVQPPGSPGQSAQSDEALAAGDPVPVSSQAFQVGPFNLAPAGQPGDRVNRLFDTMPRPAGDIAVRGITWRLVDAGGNAVDSHMVHLHHIVLMDTGRRDQLCSFPSASRFAATGMELTPAHLPDGYAYHSKADSQWQGVYDVMNNHDMPMTVSIEYTVEYSEPGTFLDVEPYFLDTTGCWGDSTFVVPGDGGPGSTFAKTKEYTMTRQGRFVGAGGHMHEGGIDVSLDGPDGEVCRAEAVYHGDPPMMMGISQCGAIDETFEVGDTYRLTARYHNDERIPDAMGIMISYVHHTDPPPPEPAVDVAFHSLDWQGLHVLLTCSNATDVNVQGSVAQSTRFGSVEGWGSTAPGCNPSPTVVTIPLTGLGRITPGTAHVEVWVSAQSGNDWVSDSLSGDFRVSGMRLTPETPPDIGPNPITIDARISPTRGVHQLSGTVQCDEPRELWLNASGWQETNVTAVRFYGYESIECDGVTPFVIPVDPQSGRLIAGSAQVTVSGYGRSNNGPGDSEMEQSYSSASRTVTVIGSSAPTGPLPPAPESRLTINSVRATANGMVVTVTLDSCLAGATGDVYAQVEEVSASNSTLPVPRNWSFAEFVCNGGPVTVDLAYDTKPRMSRVRVQADSWAATDDDSDPGESTWGEFWMAR